MKGWAMWLISTRDPAEIEQLIERLDARGLHTAVPDNPELEDPGAFRAWGTSSADIGSFWSTTPRELLAGWASGDRSVMFQLWRDPDYDLVTELFHEGDGARLEFSFDGKSGVEAETMTATLLWVALTEPTSVGFIVDLADDSIIEWRGFVARHTSSIPESAHVVWLRDASVGGPFFFVRPSAFLPKSEESDPWR